MSEHALYLTLRRALRPYGRVTRHEDRFSTSIPDVHYALRAFGRAGSGWIETKHLPAWPARADTPIKVPHPERFLQQVIWIEEETKAGGRGFVLLQAARDYVLLRPDEARGLRMGYYTRATLMASPGAMPRRLDPKRMLAWLV